MDKESIADIFNEIAVLLEIKGENPFKSRAYANAARAIESHPDAIAVLVKEKRLDEIKGLGEALRDKVTRLVESGTLPYYDELKASLPPGLPALLDIPGLGPKKIKILYEKLGVTNLESLEKACAEPAMQELAGFGEKTVANILAGIEQRRIYSSQHRIGDVQVLASSIVEALREHPDIIRVSVAGSLRRGKEVIKDIDIIASSKNPQPIMDYFVQQPGVLRVLNHGETKSSVLLEGGVQCDLRVVQDFQYPYALHHFTGSKEHNVAMRQRAISQGKKLSEWGLFREEGRGKKDQEAKEELIPCRDEEEIFRDLGLDYVAPELRENLGEIEAAEAHRLPRLIEWTALKGCFHNHTVASDGHDSLEAMAEEADELGLQYMGLADHSKSSFQANGLSEDRLLEQVEAVRKFNRGHDGVHLFSGVECDILKEGKLDFDDGVLGQLDYVVASLHAGFTQNEEEMTRRLIRAMENPHVTMLGHATGRLLLKREGYPVNIPKLLEAAAATGTWIELNANPWRLDMDWRWWRRARELGVKCVINPDAHRRDQLHFLKLGVQIARKGWLEAGDVVNTASFKEMQKLLRAKRQR